MSSRSTPRRTRGRRNQRPLEVLESRRLFSASLIDSIQAQPAELTLSPEATSASAGLSPSQVKTAYGLNSLSFNGVKGDGSGQTIAIVGAFNDPTIASDLKAFDSRFSLADPPSFTKVSQTGSTTSLPATDAGWSMELSLDVEWAHAVAPKAKILLVEANSDSLSDLLKAVDYARNASGVSVVSMSWGADEFWGQTNYDSHFTTPSGHQGVTFVAASGDDGSWYGPEWPSVSSNVLAVGGTSLSLSNSSGGYSSERGWSGSGGGVSWFENEPSYQAGVQSTGVRTTPDVAFNADPNSGFLVYDSTAYQGYKGWEIVGGTSAGAPQWAAMVAIANQGRMLAGKSSLTSAQTLSSLYSMRTTGFHDVTSGRSSYFVSAFTGYDLVTGLGTPRGDLIIAGLKNAGSTSASSSAKTTVATTTAKTAAKAAAAEEESATATSIASLLPVQTASAPLTINHGDVLTAADLPASGVVGAGAGQHFAGGAGLTEASLRGHGLAMQAGSYDRVAFNSSGSIAGDSAAAKPVLRLASANMQDEAILSPLRSSRRDDHAGSVPSLTAEPLASAEAGFPLVPIDSSDRDGGGDRRTILTALAAGAVIMLTQVNRFRRRRQGAVDAAAGDSPLIRPLSRRDDE